MTALRTTRIVLATTLMALLLSTSGCLRLVGIDNRTITPITEHDLPLTKTRDGRRRIAVDTTFHGATQTFGYNSTVWRFARMPCIRSKPGFFIMLDTGLDAPGRMTLDVVAAQKYPAYLGETDFAFVRSLDFGDMTMSNLLVLIETNRYEAQFLGLPLYRANGLVLGMASLRRAHYLAFDNGHRKVTIGVDKFAPSTNRTWESFPFVPDPSQSLVPRPYVDLPVAGQPLRLLTDSAGGPRLILNREQWDLIAPRLKVKRHRQDRYPTWGGFQEVDSYEVAELEIGPLNLKSPIVWVRRGEIHEAAPLIGLGVLGRATAVWDFAAKRFWIGQEPHD